VYCLRSAGSPLYLAAARSSHIVNIELVQKGLHNTPVSLRKRLQGVVDQAEGSMPYYSGMGCVGKLQPADIRDVPLVVPRAHDCITLFLGSRERYLQQFNDYPGTYWYAQDYIEREDGSGAALSMGSGSDTDLQAVYDEYVQKYGKDNADYLMGVMGAWQQHYRRGSLHRHGSRRRCGSRSARPGRGCPPRLGYDRLAGDLVLIRRLLEGDWKDDFLIVSPGQQVIMTYDDQVIGCLPENMPV